MSIWRGSLLLWSVCRVRFSESEANQRGEGGQKGGGGVTSIVRLALAVALLLLFNVAVRQLWKVKIVDISCILTSGLVALGVCLTGWENVLALQY